MFDRNEAESLARQEVARMRDAGRDKLKELPSWKYVRETMQGPSGQTYVVARRAGLDNSDPDSLLLVRVRVSRPGIRGRWQRVIEDLVLDSDGSDL